MKVLLINYDNGSRIPVLPQNLYHLKNCFSKTPSNYVMIYDFNLTKAPYEILLNLASEFHVIGIGFIAGYWPHREAIKIAKIINGLPYRNRIHFVIGGHGPAGAPEYYLKKLGADAVYVGPADMMVDDIHVDDGIVYGQEYRTDVSQYYGNGAEMGIYKRITFPNTRNDEFAIQILSGRGCPYNCAFCFRMGKSYQQIPIESLIADIEQYAVAAGIRHFQFSDELLMISRANILKVCIALADLQERLGTDLFFDCNGRLNIASECPDVLGAMKEVGFRYINYGCESMSQEVLNAINKKQTVGDIRIGVENTLKAGMSPGLNFMWGNPGDNAQTLAAARDFIIGYSDLCELRTIRPMTPYPGTDLYKKLESEGKINGVDHFYDVHTNSDLFSFHFMPCSNRDADQMLGEANAEIIRAYNHRKECAQLDRLSSLYSGRINPVDFRGFREV